LILELSYRSGGAGDLCGFDIRGSWPCDFLDRERIQVVGLGTGGGWMVGGTLYTSWRMSAVGLGMTVILAVSALYRGAFFIRLLDFYFGI